MDSSARAIPSKSPFPNLSTILEDEEVEVGDIRLSIVDGNFVKKSTLRTALNMRNRLQFMADIQIICQKNEEFNLKYQPFKNSRRLPFELAAFYCRHIFPERKVVGE